MIAHLRSNEGRSEATIRSHGHANSRALSLFIYALVILAAILQSGCAGVTSAKGNSTTSAASDTAPSGALSLSPATITFGNVPVGSVSNQSLSVTNSGSAAVTISQATATGASFSIGGASLPLTVSPGNTFTFTASFAPTAAGNASGSASITSAQLSSPLTIPMTGTAMAVAPAITSPPIAQSVLIGQAATFSVAASGTAPLNYQWQKNGTAISGATSASYTTPAEIASDNGAQFTVVVSNAAGSVASIGATLTVTAAPVAPSITTQPANQTIFVGQTATFFVAANGTLPLSYQWRKNGIAIGGATAASYTTPAEVASDNGAQFTVVVINAAGNIISNAATLTVNPDPVAPSITSQPASQTITAGQTATFSVTASGTTPLSYQWQKNGAAISGATLANYTTPAETTADTGAQFAVVVTNSAGNATSNVAILTVNPAPVAPSITAQPTSQTITAGQTATFSVTASGTAPLSYQWQKNGAAISGATAASYTTPAETTADTGAQFTVVVTNSVGNATSNAAILTVNPAPVAPSISTQPASQTVTAGQTATFSVTASGTAPLNYQWRKNGTSIGGATSATYTTPAETTADTGAQFTVVVTNSVGNATSNAAILTVNPAPVAPSITTQPTSQTITAGQTATFSVTASGTAPLSYQWQKNGAAISGATAASYTTPAETTSDSGAQFTVAVTNSAGSAASNAAILTVNPAPVAPSISTQPASQTVTAGQTATFSVTASGTAPLNYQWRKNGTSIGGATSATYTTPAETTADTGAQFTVVVTNSVGNATSNAAILTVNPAPVAPSITTQPASQTVTAGQTATFSVTASGTAPLSYQWQKNGAAISGATAASYTTPAETTADTGAQFTVVVTNSVGNATSNAAILTVNPAPVAPSITTQPASQTVTAGQTATFSVTASGTAPLSYQWQKNGAAISGATAASYTTPAETTADTGAQFTVVVTNSVGNATSNAAILTVNPAPVAPSITTQPASQSITAGQTAIFSVTASGTAPLSYQWRKNGTGIGGATSASYTTPAETTSDSGAQFTVVVTNSAGNVTSNAATLTVNPAPVTPSITTQPTSQTITAGQTASFLVTASGTAPLSYQWQKNGAAIGGATSASYTTPTETTSDSGAQFTVVVTNSIGNATSNAAILTVNPAPVAPSITTQPASQTVTAGQTAAFSVTASGTAPLSYQWQKNGAAISGATAASYTTPAETTADTGAQFTVVVTNSVGNATSNAAILTVNPAPVAPSITTQPASQTVTAGQTATFSVTASGTAPLSYQWQKNGAAISGATAASYTTPAETTADTGAQFTVVVTNSVGNATSNAAILTVNPAPVAPSITTQPASQTVTAGQTATFSVTASGTAPLSYQWQKNGAAISGATSASYTTPAETTADTGAQFTVVVTNSVGNATSNAAILTVNPAPVAPSITTQPTSQTITAGQTATFSVTASGTAPLSYQWQKNGAAISGATSASYTTPAETTADTGAQFTIVVTNSVGNATSNAAILTVNPAPVAPSITTQPASQTVTAGQTATFSVTASGTAPLSYQWQKNGAAISGATAASYTTPAETTADTGAQFTVVVTNSVGNATSNAAILTVNPAPVAPSITTQPASQTVTAGQTATFSVTASGTAPLSYQWRKNGSAISGATAASYTTPAETTADNGAQFTVVVTNSAGNATSNVAILTVNPAPVAPSITTQPASQTVTAGQTATFSVTASGTAPLSYQWEKNGAAISGATSASYTTPTETTADTGAQFAVVVTNSVGNATSNAAILTVNPAPVAPSITTQPASQTVTAGQTATFSVTASGTAPLSYQWRKNGTAISGATAASYTTPATPAADNGAQFSVVVTNSAGSVTSNAATLTVNVPPSITAQPASQTVTAGQTATFSVTASGTAPLSYQWRKNGTAISGATSASYTTPATTTADNGAQFTVVVTNSVGSVTSNAATLTVNAVLRALTASTSALSFGNVSTGSSSLLPVTFTNSGTSNITISNVTISGPGFTSIGLSNGQIVTPGQVVTLNVTFAPAATGSVTGSVSVASNASNSPASITLSGTGVQPISHSATLTWTASTSAVIGYNVYRGTVSGGPYTKINSSVDAITTFADTSVQAGQTYFWVVTAVDSSNVESLRSGEVSATIPTP